MEKITKNKSKHIFSVEDMPRLGAFVVMDLKMEKKRIMSKYRKTWFKRCRFSYKIKGKFLPKLQQPPEPSNIKWENLQVGKCNRFFR